MIKILIPVDMSERDRIVSTHHLRVAAKFPIERAAAGDGMQVYVLHVIPHLKWFVPHSVDRAEAYVAKIVEEMSARGEAVKGMVRKGDPATEIVNAANEFEADFIVMGTHGRRGLDRLVVSSTTEAVLARATVPVVLLNEATMLPKTEQSLISASSYVAGVIWNEVARGLASEEQALVILEEKAAMGLDREVLFSTFKALSDTGAPVEWLDPEFQADARRRYLPEKQRDAGADAA
jgi:nucleotide-binding universal stress UspA family protein